MNRVLFKAAAIVNIAAAALIYVACSGDDGKDGAQGTSCTGVPSVTVAGGIDISCGGVPVGTLQPGTAGGPGAQGPAGPQGPAGGTGPGGEVGCYLQVATAGFDVVCGGAVVGNIGGPGGTAGGGCAIADQAEYYKFTCSPTESYMLAKAWCNYNEGTPPNTTPKTQAYDPATMLCNINAGVSGNCAGTGYVVKEAFCADDKILARCGARYILDSLGAPTNTPKPDSNGVYAPATQFCLNDGSVPTTPPVIFKPFFDAELTAQSNIVTGKVTALCGTPTASYSGKFSKFDFCSAGRIYARCESENKDYIPTSQFCQLAGNTPDTVEVASQTSNNATASAGLAGTIKPLCGTTSSTNGGRFITTKFCVGTGAAAKTYDKCGTAASINPSTGVANPAGEYVPTSQYCAFIANTTGGQPGGVGSCSDPALTTQLACEAPKGTWDFHGDGDCSDPTLTTQATCEAPKGTWDPDGNSGAGECSDNSLTTEPLCTAQKGNWTPKKSCSDNSLATEPLCTAQKGTWTGAAYTSSTYTSISDYQVKTLEGCPANSTNLYNPTTHSCISSGVVHPRCEGLEAASGTITSAQYDVTKQVCDTRGSGFLSSGGGKAGTAENGATTVLKSLGGKLYDYKAIGNQVWIAKNLDNSRFATNNTSDNPEAVTGVPSAAAKFTWAQAKLACPDGWSLPTRTQWNALVDASSSTQEPGIVLRSTSGQWSAERTPTSTLANGFNAVAFIQTNTDGITENSGTTTGLVPSLTGKYAFWWATDEDPASATGVGGNLNNAFVRFLRDVDVNVFEGSISKASLIPVRCIKS